MTSGKTSTPRVIEVPQEYINRFKIESTRFRPRFIRLLLSGPSGVGKTTVIGTASRHIFLGRKEIGEYNNVLYIGYDRDGDDTFLDMKVEADRVRPNCYEGNVGQKQGIINLLTWLHSEETPYDVIALDPYNKMQEMLMEELIEEGVQRSKTTNRNTIHDSEKMELDDYRRLLTRCNHINDLLLSLNKHVIVTCISDIKIDPMDMKKVKPEEKDRILSLSLEGRMAHLLSANFSLHGIMKKTGQMNNLDTITMFNQFNSESKTRFRIDNNINNLTFPKLLNEMKMLKPEWKLIDWKHDSQGFLPVEVVRD